jgi:hypothetical protein
LRFDPVLLHEDLAAVLPGEWMPHYNDRDYGGDWRGAALRSTSGSAGDLNAPSAGSVSFAATPLLARCPYFRQVLDGFECPLKAVRLLSLAPGSFIREHTDNALDYEDGEVRIHVPIRTNPGVEFYLSNERLLLEEGGAYYLNVNLPHRVNNRGAAARVHLVIDAEVNDWLRDLFARSPEIPRCAAPVLGVEAFRESALASGGLRDRLRAIGDAPEFAAEAARSGRASEFEFHEGDVDALLRGPARAGNPGGLPYALSVRDGEAFVEWLDDGHRELDEPFFDDSVRALLRNPYTRFTRRVAPISAGEHDGLAPTGFIFHMSRCGSTLVARLLRAAGYRVISEAPPVDSAIQAGREDWLRWIVEALGAGRLYFVKLDAWHIHNLPLIHAAFPRTRWIFVHRDPAQVLASHRRSPGRHMLPGALDPRALDMAPSDITAIPRDDWPARVLAKIRDSALRHRDDPSGLFVDYRELPDAAWGSVARHFEIAIDEEAITRMREAARFDAKNPGMPFDQKENSDRR